jgi:hypothetical protein
MMLRFVFRLRSPRFHIDESLVTWVSPNTRPPLRRPRSRWAHKLVVSFFYRLTGISQTIAEGKSITGDLGGKASTKEYTSAIIAKIGKV